MPCREDCLDLILAHFETIGAVNDEKLEFTLQCVILVCEETL